MSIKKPQKKTTYDARQAFTDGVMAGAEYFDHATKHRTGTLGDAVMANLRDSAKEISESFEICKKLYEKRAKDWRIGHFAAPTNDESSYQFPFQKGLVKFFVIDTHPSGHQGVECADGVLELAIWWVVGGIPSRAPSTYLVPADKWAVA